MCPLGGSCRCSRILQFLETTFHIGAKTCDDRNQACNQDTAADRIYGLKDTHTSATRTEADLVDVTDLAASPPNLNESEDVNGDGREDQGWFIQLLDPANNPVGEKVLAKGIVFYKTLYITTFIPSEDPCIPGGDARVFAINYMTGEAVLAFDGSDLARDAIIGGGIPSSPVPVITSLGQKLFISIGSATPIDGSDSIEAGIPGIDPLAPVINFFYLWWREP